MKTVTVRTASNQYTVNLNNASEADELTPSMARAARNIAVGFAAYVTVTDGDTTYRVTKGVKKVQ